MPRTYETFDPPRDTDAVCRMVALAFGGTQEGARDWLTNAGVENLRVVQEEGRTVASLLRIPMGAYFGGRSVPLLGIAGVAVAPEERGRGHAAFLMHNLVRSAFEEGWALAGLYASTHRLYRKFGFEHAGHRFQYTVPLVRIDAGGPLSAVSTLPGELRIVALQESDDPEIRACYQNFARMYEGTLDRGPYIWARIRKLREDAYTGFGVRDAAGSLRGYLFMSQQRSNPLGRFSVALSDFVFTDEAAGRRLWELLHDFSMMGENLTFCGGPTHPALQLLRQQRHKVELKDDWLIRVLDFKRAIESRAYSPAINTELRLELNDDTIPENSGRWLIRIADGRASAARDHSTAESSSVLRLSARAIATLFSGFNTAHQARLLGLADGDDTALSLADSVFARSTPWMSDMY
ncbi:MAG: GNAT family N-acetyltransferase [Phycisphaeraceae bacterium]|nr:GNAT family N-acetyltransferase [Phycisphaeraceae bacterium]MBX3368402.1 GNAT family N-acetyltransferase [Phycisphaeraceae bacterium]